MRRYLTLMGALLALGSLSVLAASSAVAEHGGTGNGAPNGAHYNLNMIGVPKDKSPDFDGGNGKRMFVDLGRDGAAAKTRINLSEGPFDVLDANGTDGTAAFQLPNPDVDGDGTTSYSVYVRALGKPGGHADMQSCYEDSTGTWCAVDFAGGVSQIEIERTKGKQTFENVSKDLLYIDYCVTWDNGVCTDVDQVPLFSESVSYFWEYDNQGLKLAQFRFYDGDPTDTPW